MDSWMLTPEEIKQFDHGLMFDPEWEKLIKNREDDWQVDLYEYQKFATAQADKMIRAGWKTDEQWIAQVRDLVLRGRMDYLGLTENEQQFLMDIGREIWILDVVRSEAREEALREVVKMFDEARRMRREWIGDREGPNYDRHTDYAVIEQLRIKSGRMPEGK